MKNLYRYLLILLSLLFVVACANPEPKKEISTPLKQIAAKVKIPLSELEMSFIKENYVQEAKQTKVLVNCFKTGKVRLQKSCKKEINSFLKSLTLSQKRNIIIEVHTDKGGTSKKNLLISKKRSLAVASSLFYKEYKFSKVYYGGFGESKLLYDLQTPQADLQNRRVVIYAKEKNREIDTKVYKLYKKSTKVASKKSSKKKYKKIKKVDLKIYTGKPDIGWMYFGKKELQEKFNISCMQDKPRKVKRRKTKEKNSGEYISNIYLKKYKLQVGKDNLVIWPISIFDDAYLPQNNPNILLTNSNYSKKVLTTVVNSYYGEKGILYRVFVNKKNSPKSSMMCMDLVISNKSAELLYGVAYFKEKNKTSSVRLLPLR